MAISVLTAAVSPLDDPGGAPSEDQLAAMAFLARYSGRTLEAYRHDLRYFFQWAADHDLEVLAATRARIEMYRSTMEQRDLAPSTLDRRLSTVCGYFRFAHIDGRIPANPAQYVRRPKVQPTERHGLDRGELGRFVFTAEHFDTTMARSPCCSVSTGYVCPRRAQPTSRTSASNGVTARSASSVRATSQR